MTILNLRYFPNNRKEELTVKPIQIPTICNLMFSLKKGKAKRGLRQDQNLNRNNNLIKKLFIL